jgi:hypothetical protein
VFFVLAAIVKGTIMIDPLTPKKDLPTPGDVVIRCERLDTPVEGIYRLVFANGKSVVVHAVEPEAAPHPNALQKRMNREVEVHIEWDLKRMSSAQKELLWKITEGFRAMGVGFDTGCGCGCLDWEWDWSLSGPVSVFFRCFTQSHLENRHHPKRQQEEGPDVAGVEAVRCVKQLAEGLEEDKEPS